MGRAAIAILSTENLLHNLKIVKQQAKNSKIIAMVKANAYGHGLRSVALRLEEHVDILGVASIDEALALRKSGIKIPILLAEGIFEPDELLIASTESFQVVFHGYTQLNWLRKASCPRPIQAWLKVDTGMGRLGFAPDKVIEAYQILKNSNQISKVRIMSHLACADEADNILNERQLNVFTALISEVTQFNRGQHQVEFSLCNSAGIFQFPHSHYDYVRPGMALYGVSPLREKTATALNLRPVMTLQTSLISVKQMRQGANIGYGARYVCKRDMQIGVIAFGYGDGYPITARDGTPVLVNGIKCPLIGRVSMDMMTIDLSACPQAQVGDPVILWGNDLPVEEIAQFTSDIPYNILTGMQHRVKFFWTKI